MWLRATALFGAKLRGRSDPPGLQGDRATYIIVDELAQIDERARRPARKASVVRRGTASRHHSKYWLPQGARECARRIRQMQAAKDNRERIAWLREDDVLVALTDHQDLRRLARRMRRWERRSPTLGLMA